MEKITPEIVNNTMMSPDLRGAEMLEMTQFDLKQRILELNLQTEEGEGWQFIFKNVRHLGISHLYHQNVLAEISVHKDQEIPKTFLNKLGEDHQKLSLVEFKPESGAAVVVICEKFELFKV